MLMTPPHSPSHFSSTPQTDLELASSSLAKSDADLAHARASNKRQSRTAGKPVT